MADAPAAPPTKKKKAGSAIPKPALYIGAGVGGYLVYRWWKNRQGSSNTATPAAAAQPGAATGTDSGIGAFPGDGTGGGGGGGIDTGGLASDIAAALAANQAAGNGSITPPPGPAVPTTSDTTITPTSTPAQTTTQTTTSAPVKTLAPSSGGIGQAAGSAIGASAAQAFQSAPVSNDNPGVFHLRNGTVSFDPSAVVRHGNQVAYGLPNANVGAQAQRAGGVVETGAQLEAKGWKNLNRGASYLVR